MKKLALSYLGLVFKAWSKGRLVLRCRPLIITMTVAATYTASTAATVDWEGSTGGTPGDGIFWSDPLNWQGDAIPASADDITLGAPGVGGSTVQLDAQRTVNSIAFDESLILGAFGTSLTLNNTSGNISVQTGDTVTMNARLAATGNHTLSGGGTLFMNNQLAPVPGNWTVDGAGTTLMIAYPGQPSNPSRSDAPVLGTGARSITLTNGGTFKLAGSGYNPDGSSKTFVIGAGGGVINVAAGFQQMSLDDAGQFSALAGAGAFTKTGNGTLVLAGQDFNAGVSAVIVNGGVLRLNRVQGNTAANRVSAFATAAPITVNNGGMLSIDAGVVGILDQSLTLNAGGTVAFNGADHELGVRTGTATTLTLNGGTILARDAFNLQSTGRLPRINSQILGSGTVNVIGGTVNAGNSRLVLQRGDAGSTFSGTWRIHGNTWLEQNSRNGATVNTGNTLGTGAAVELFGHNAGLDLRDNGAAASSNLAAYSGNSLVLSGEAGSLGRVTVNWMTANTGNVYQFGNFTAGNNRLYLTNGNNYGLRFSGTNTLTGSGAVNPVLEVNGANAKLEFNGAFNEHVSGDGLTVTGRNGTVDFSGGINLSTVNLLARETRLFGTGGAIGLGSLSGAATINVNSGLANIGGNLASSGTMLHLNNNLANTGSSVVAVNNGDRIADSARVNLLGNSTLRLTSLNNANAAETIGTVNVTGSPTIDAVMTGAAAAGSAITINNLVTGATSAVNFSGTSLGTAAGSGKILIAGPVFAGTMGAQYRATNEWAKYGANGVTAFVAGDYNLNPATGLWANHVKVNSATGYALGGNETAETVNLQFSAGGQALALGANNLVLTGGGILATNGAISGTTGTLTTAAGTPNLFVHNSSTLDITARMADPSATNPMTLVKNGSGTMRLVHQGTAIGGGGGGATPPLAVTHTNTFTGGVVINEGTLEVWRSAYLGTGPVTIQGGALFLNNPVAPATVNTAGAITANGGNNQVLNYGNDVIFNASGSLVADDNGESNDANAGGNAYTQFGSLTVNGGHIIGFGAYGNGQIGAASSGSSTQDFAFTGAAFSGTPTFNTTAFRSGNSHLVLGGAVSGSAFNLEAFGDSAGVVQLGSGGADNAANTYSGTIMLTRTSGNSDPVLRLNKANGTTAVTGDIIINGGTLAWGTGATQAENSNVTISGLITPTGSTVALVSPNNLIANQWTGNSIATAFANTTSGNNQINDSSNVTLMFGTVNEGARVVNEKFNTFRQLNGNFNTGFGKIEVNTYEISGGSYSHNSGGTFVAGTMNLLSGAPDINVANNFAGAVSNLEVGSGGLNINGQNIVLGNGDYFTPSAGAVLKLSGPMNVQGDPLNLTRTDRQRGIISGLNGRELASNWVDLAAGNRPITVADDIFWTINTQIRNGGIVKNGDGTLAVQNWRSNNFTGGVTVNNGIFLARSNDAAGSGAVDINIGGTVKLDGGWTWANDLTVSGAGADIPQSGGVLELGALVAEMGRNRLTGNVAIDGGATFAANMTAIPTTASQSAGGGVAAAGALNKAALVIEKAVTGTGNLTLTGNGNGVIIGGVATDGALSKSGAGTWVLAGGGTYPGVTSVQAGTLQITNGSALGTTAGRTVVHGGATLALSGGIVSAEPFELHGAGWEDRGGALRSVSGANVMSGNGTVATTATLRADAGASLSIGIPGGTLTGSAGAGLILTGAGSGAIGSNITLTAPSGTALTKSGTGTWNLRGNNVLAGPTTVTGGTLQLASGLSGTHTLALSGGSFTNTGAAQTAGDSLVASGGGTLNGGAGLNIGFMSRNAGATVNFSGTVITLTPNLAGSNILGGYATYGNDWAVAGASVSALPSASYTALVNATGTVGAFNHGLLDYDSNGFSNAAHAAGISGATFKVSSGVKGLALGANTLTVTNAGILKAGSGVFNLGGTGLVSAATENDELVIHTNDGGAIYTSNPLIGAGTGGLTKAGNGELRLFGSSAFTGAINVNGGTLAIAGNGGTHPAALGAQTGQRNITLNNGTFSVFSGDYDLNVAGGAQMQIVVGTGGGTLHAGNGNLLLNDANQLSGPGDLTITGGGRVSINANYPNFTGDITVKGGTLSLANGIGNGPGSGGTQIESQKVTMGTNTGLMLLSDVAQTVEFQGNNQVTVAGADRAFKGPVTINGNVDLVMAERDASSTARSLGFYGPLSGSGTINVIGTNTNGRVQFGGGTSDFSGTINVGTNASIELRQPTALGNDTTAPTVNLAGESRSRLMLRGYQGGDYNLNVNATGKFTEIYAGRIENYNSTFNSQGLFKINSLTTSGSGYVTFQGDNSNWVAVKNGVTATGNLIAVANTNTTFLGRTTVGGLLDKRGGSVLALEGATSVTGKTVIQQGWIDLRGAGTLATTGIDIRGGNLMISNNAAEGSNPNRVAGVPINLGGGSLRVVGSTSLGTLTPVPGTTELNYAMDTQSGVTPLVINDMSVTRQTGSQIRLASTYGTIGAPSSNQTFPRILVGANGLGLADNFGTGLAGSVDVIPWMVMGNEFVAYRHTTDSGLPLGYVQVTNGSMRADAADGTGAGQLRSTTAAAEIMRFTGTATTTLGGNATWRAIKMDGGTTRTINLGTNTLTVDRGAIIHVANDQRIGEATGTGRLQSGTNELQLTVNGGNSIIGAAVQDGAVGQTHLVKNGGGTLRFDGASANTFTGNIHMNAGLITNTAANQIPSTATLIFNGGRWEPGVSVTGPNADIALGNNIVVNTNSRGIGGDPALSLDNGSGGQDNNYQLGSVTINNGVEWSIAGWDGTDGNFNATAGNPHVFNATPTLVLFQGRTAAAANEAVMTFSGPINGGYYVQSIGGVAGTNPSNTTLQIGGGATDTLGNTGDVILLGNAAASGMPIVRLNKAPGTNAIGGNLAINGGQVINLAANQIADSSDVVVNGDPVGSNQMGWSLNNQTESIRNLTINGGGVTTGTGTINVLGNLTVNIGSQADSLQINSAGGTVNVTGTTTIGDFGRIVLGANAATLDLGGALNMTGGVIQQNSGAGANILRLRGDVTAISTPGASARIANVDDTDTFIEFHDLRQFTVADGPRGDDLILSGTVRNSTAPGAAATTGLYKSGAGTMVIAGTAAAPNTFNGDVTVSSGQLHLAKAAGQNAFAGTSVFVGDGNGPAQLVLRNSNQIPNAAGVTIDAQGVLDLQSFNTSEAVGNLSSNTGGVTTLGPSSALTVDITTNTLYAGSILGGGDAAAAVTKNGTGKWSLTGNSEYSGDTIVNAGILEVDGFLNGTEINVNNTATLSGIGKVADVIVNNGGTLSPGNSPGVLTTRSVTTSAGSTSIFEIGSLTAGNGLAFHDQIKSFGTVSLDGTLTVSLVNAFQPAYFDEVYLWLNDGTDAITGTFTGLPEGAAIPTGGGDWWVISYLGNGDAGSLANDVKLTYVPEPSAALLAAGTGLIALARRRRRVA